MFQRQQLMSAVFAGLILVGPGLTGRLRAADDIDKKLSKSSSRPASSTRTPSHSTPKAILSARSSDGEKREINVKAVYDIERPNRLSIQDAARRRLRKGPRRHRRRQESDHSRQVSQTVHREKTPTASSESASGYCRSGPR